MIEYRQEFLHLIENDLAELGRLHCDEVMNQPIDFDVDLYRKMEDASILKIFTARFDGVLVGYMVVILTPDIHARGEFIVADDGFFMHKDFRGNGYGVGLLEFSENCLRQDGHKRFHISTMAKKPIDDLLVAKGYTLIERKYEKVL